MVSALHSKCWELRWTFSISSREGGVGIEILFVASCLGNWDQGLSHPTVSCGRLSFPFNSTASVNTRI